MIRPVLLSSLKFLHISLHLSPLMVSRPIVFTISSLHELLSDRKIRRASEVSIREVNELAVHCWHHSVFPHHHHEHEKHLRRLMEVTTQGKALVRRTNRESDIMVGRNHLEENVPEIKVVRKFTHKTIFDVRDEKKEEENEESMTREKYRHEAIETVARWSRLTHVRNEISYI